MLMCCLRKRLNLFLVVAGLPMSGEEKITTREFKDNFSAVYPQVAANYEGWLTHSSTPTRSPSKLSSLPLELFHRENEYLILCM